jgi:hypothetical protein
MSDGNPKPLEGRIAVITGAAQIFLSGAVIPARREGL